MNIFNDLHSTSSMMPGILPEHDGAFITSPSSRKRKRDQAQSEPANINKNAKFMPSSTHNLNPSILFQYADHPKENTELSFRQRSFPRKRRILQQPYSQHHQAWLNNQGNLGQTKLLSPNVCLASSSDPSSPPVSPRTVVSNQYPLQQQNYCTPATCLRPCHICHRKPTTREVLDAYADCDLCGERSCYICLRQCDGPNCSDGLRESPMGNDRLPGQCRMVCSCCAVEGVTGEGLEVVRCLDCVRNHISHWQTV